MIRIKVRYYEVDNQGNKYMHVKRFNSDHDASMFIDEIRKSLNLFWYEIDVFILFRYQFAIIRSY